MYVSASLPNPWFKVFAWSSAVSFEIVASSWHRHPGSLCLSPVAADRSVHLWSQFPGVRDKNGGHFQCFGTIRLHCSVTTNPPTAPQRMEMRDTVNKWDVCVSEEKKNTKQNSASAPESTMGNAPICGLGFERKTHHQGTAPKRLFEWMLTLIPRKTFWIRRENLLMWIVSAAFPHGNTMAVSFESRSGRETAVNMDK